MKRHSDIHFQYTSRTRRGLNHIECLFSILRRQALREGTLSPLARYDRLSTIIAAYNSRGAPFEWHKKAITPTGMEHHYADYSSEYWGLLCPETGLRIKRKQNEMMKVPQ